MNRNLIPASVGPNYRYTTETLIEHIPVLLEETLDALRVHPGGWYIDGTVGGGGHAEAILDRSRPGGRLLGLDADPEAIARARERLARFGEDVLLVNANFREIEAVARRHGFVMVDGVLFDLGLSSFQLAAPERGFAFQMEGPLDMRYSPQQTVTAAVLVNSLSEEELADLLFRYGEERHSRAIARSIVRHRPLRTTGDLVRAVEDAVGKRRDRIHPATRTFQALRIAVNEELPALQEALPQAVNLLRPGGRLVVISFHSLEDRIVKEFFRQEAIGCICPPHTPVCRCGRRPRLAIITKKPIRPSRAEMQRNPRSRSARLRAAERLASDPSSS